MKLSLRDRRWDPEKDEPAALWGRLNEAWRDLVSLVQIIDKRLTIRTIDFTGPQATITISIASDTRPIGIVLAGLYETTTNATSAVTFSWTWTADGMTTTSFSALPAGTYRVTFIVIGGA